MTQLDGFALHGYDQVVQVGEGGLGRVYRARRISTGGTVAIKELRDVTEASPAWHRAMREVEAMLRLKGHPNVVSVEEVVPGPNGPCIVMEYLGAGSLHDRLGQTHLSVPEVVFVGHEVATALLAAHTLGVIHRDVKPHNLLVSGFGHVKVADFGIAALMRDSGVRTQTQSLTLAYASPEELDGAADVGPPTDVYSLAATLAHLATGIKPSFRDRALTSLPFDHEPGLGLFGQTLRRSLAIEPAQRPTMTELVAIFDDAQTRLGGRRLANLPVGATPLVAAPYAPQSAAGPPDHTAVRPYAAATAISPLRPAASPPPPPPPPPPPLVAEIAPAASGPPGSNSRRPTLVALAAVVATLSIAGAGFLVFGGSSEKDEQPLTGAGSVAPTGATVADQASSPPATTAPTQTVPPLTAAPPPTTIEIVTTVPPDPVTVASAELQRLIAADRPTANALVGQFVPQLSAKYVGLDYEGVRYGPVEILADHLLHRNDYGAILVDSGAFAFEINDGPMIGWYLSIVPAPFSTKAAATQWCTDRGLGPDYCFGREFKPAR